MTLEPLLNAGPVVIIHTVSAILALLLGAMLLWRRKGTQNHKFNGKLWVGLMAVVAMSSFFINELRTFGPFSAIHILSVVTLVSLVQAVVAIRRGNARQHQIILYGLFYGGLVGAGLFTFMPGRVLYRTFFGNPTFSLVDLSNVWIFPFSFALIVGLFFYWNARRAP